MYEQMYEHSFCSNILKFSNSAILHFEEYYIKMNQINEIWKNIDIKKIEKWNFMKYIIHKSKIIIKKRHLYLYWFIL